MKRIQVIAFALFTISLVSCDPKILESISKTINTFETPVSNAEIVGGLKEALGKGSEMASGNVSKADGFFKNPAIKILWPAEVKNVEEKLRQLGFNKLCDDFTMSMNRGAEQASAKAVPIFKNAITSMSISDAMGILKGNKTSATDYLRKTTGEQLIGAFKPVIDNALSDVGATKYWSDITTTYNRIPTVTKVNTDLSSYVTGKAIDGLFVYVAEEERNIRANPLARTTDLLKKVFKLQD
jgi:hypothetical protein